MSQSSFPMPTPAPLAYVVGIDIGMESCMMCALTMEKRQVIKPSPFANKAEGFSSLFERLECLGASPEQILVGLEATSRYGENLYHAFFKRGYRVCLLHPAQMHAFAQQRGLRAKTDQVDAMTIARALLSGEARFGYVPTEQVATYRELVRLQQQRESMMSSATKTRSTRFWWFCFLSLPRCLPTQHDLLLWHSSSAIPAPKPSHRRKSVS